MMSKICKYIKENWILFILWFSCLIWLLVSVCLLTYGQSFFVGIHESHPFLATLLLLFITCGVAFGIGFGIVAFPIELLSTILKLKADKKIYTQIREQFSNEFSNVVLKNGVLAFETQDVSCLAKLSENGEVIMNLQVSTTNYIRFFNCVQQITFEEIKKLSNESFNVTLSPKTFYFNAKNVLCTAKLHESGEK